ncbi:hypothetical protein NDU88_007173 [Pleurodeles waltl]|uniref:Uncharacterized protein n=1 Tax=Pleurodeles waltl TaxID=8319 RepID=A0AAV7QL95_PLEWA|nr:hypothetical protein NDU88_007173 [Pleurodeles waltl]
MWIRRPKKWTADLTTGRECDAAGLEITSGITQFHEDEQTSRTRDRILIKNPRTAGLKQETGTTDGFKNKPKMLKTLSTQRHDA